MSNDPKDTVVDLSKLANKLVSKSTKPSPDNNFSEFKDSDSVSYKIAKIIELLDIKDYPPLYELCTCDFCYGVRIVFINRRNTKISVPDGFEVKTKHQYGENVIYVTSYFDYGRQTTLNTRIELTTRKLQTLFDWIKELE